MQAEGVYKAKITDNGLGKSRTGNFQAQLLVVITHDEDGAELVDPSTSAPRPLKRTVFLPITPKTKARVLSELECLGYDLKDEAGKLVLKAKALIPGTEESFVFKGKEVWLECSHEEWQGKVREKWQICRRKMGGISAEDASQFDSIFGDAEGNGSFD